MEVEEKEEKKKRKCQVCGTGEAARGWECFSCYTRRLKQDWRCNKCEKPVRKKSDLCKGVCSKCYYLLSKPSNQGPQKRNETPVPFSGEKGEIQQPEGESERLKTEPSSRKKRIKKEWICNECRKNARKKENLRKGLCRKCYHQNNLGGKAITKAVKPFEEASSNPEFGAKKLKLSEPHSFTLSDPVLGEGELSTVGNNEIKEPLSEKSFSLNAELDPNISEVADDKEINFLGEIRQDSRFTPTSTKWRTGQCSALGLVMSKKEENRRKSSMLGAPLEIDWVRADGNCLFRSVSKEVTLSEEHHAKFRKLAVDTIRSEECRQFFEDLIGKSVDSYLMESDMEKTTIWGTEVECFALATALATPICIYYKPPGVEDHGWYFHQPIHSKLDAAGQLESIYLVNKGNHFNRVLSVQTNRRCRGQEVANENPESNEGKCSLNLETQSKLSSLNTNRESRSKIVRSTSTVELPIKTCCRDQTRCAVCNKTDQSRKNIPLEARTDIFIEKGLLIPEGVRCCPNHLNGKVMKNEAVEKIKTQSESVNISIKDITKLMLNVRKIAKRKGLDFDTPGRLSEEDYQTMTGLSKNNFDDLCTYIDNSIRSTKVRSKRTCVALFMAKLKTGMSHRSLATIFGVPRRSVGKAIAAVRSILAFSFVPNYLGLGHKRREDVINHHSTTLAKALFASEDPDTAILVADGTYMFIEKSSNYTFQRKSYSVHKSRPLLKPMLIVTSTGYILDVLGPYLADGKNNDAQILEKIMNDSCGFRRWLKDGDIFVLDRGFRDCIEMLHELGLVTKMPHFLTKKSQHTTEESNENRLVTKIRWVVESANGAIKKWKMFDNTFPNTQIPFIGDYVQIICAIINAYRPERTTSKPEDETLAKRMLQKAKEPNRLQIYLEENNLIRKKVIWKEIDGGLVSDFPKLTDDELSLLTLGIYHYEGKEEEKQGLPDFPKLSEEDLTSLTMGSYQLKQAKSYTYEHLNVHGSYSLYVHKENERLLFFLLQSRHTSSKQYRCYVEYDKYGDVPVTGWYCQCKAGARTVGCCAHIASIIWHLGYNRHKEEAEKDLCKLSQNYFNFVQDAGQKNLGWSEESESEDSGSEETSDS